MNLSDQFYIFIIFANISKYTIRSQVWPYNGVDAKIYSNSIKTGMKAALGFSSSCSIILRKEKQFENVNKYLTFCITKIYQ